MNYKNIFSVLPIVALLFLPACSKKIPSSDEAAKRMVAYSEPAFIMSIEVKELLDKGGITSKENIPMIAQMLFNDKIEYMTNPEKVGLDLKGKSYMAVSTNGTGNVIWTVTKINDKEKFEKMLKDEGNDKFEEIEGYNTIVEKDEVIMGWNESLLIMVFSQGKNVKDAFIKYVTAIKEDKKPTEAFEKFFNEKADVATMTNFNKFIELQKNMPEQMKGSEKDMAMLNNVSNKMKGSYSMFSVGFENDKVIVDIKNTFTDAIKKEMNFFSKDGLPKEMLSQIGSNKLEGFVSMNGNVKAYIDWLVQIMGEKDIFAEAQEKSGLDVKRIMNSLKGNVLFSFLGFLKKESSYTDSEGVEEKYEEIMPQFSFITTLSDNYIETIVDSVLKDKKKGNYFVVGNEYNPQYIAFRPGILFMANDEELFINPVMNSNPVLDNEASKVLAKPLSFYFNLKSIIGNLDKSDIAQKIAKKFKIIYGGMDMNSGHAELILDNGGKNSLWTLINIGVESTADMATSFK